jgi:hypothetical protein
LVTLPFQFSLGVFNVFACHRETARVSRPSRRLRPDPHSGFRSGAHPLDRVFHFRPASGERAHHRPAKRRRLRAASTPTESRGALVLTTLRGKEPSSVALDCAASEFYDKERRKPNHTFDGDAVSGDDLIAITRSYEGVSHRPSKTASPDDWAAWRGHPSPSVCRAAGQLVPATIRHQRPERRRRASRRRLRQLYSHIAQPDRRSRDPRHHSRLPRPGAARSSAISARRRKTRWHRRRRRHQRRSDRQDRRKLSRSDRVSKYNNCLRIGFELGAGASYINETFP